MASNTPRGGHRGALIVIEGLDRAGKTSQCQLLREKLEGMGVSVRYVKFPDRSTPTGQMINQYLTEQRQQDDHSIHLIFSANRWEAVHSIRSDIYDGTTVIIDRYSYSGAVYSTAKSNPSLTLEWAWAPEVGLPQPDITLFLGISPDEAAKRGGYGEERYETSQMQTRVRQLFRELFDKVDDELVHFIDAGRSIDEVASRILQPVLQCIGEMGSRGPLQVLGPLKP